MFRRTSNHFRTVLRMLCCAAICGLATPAIAQEGAATASEGERMSAAIQDHRLIKSLREVEADARELYYEQSFILLYLHGGRTEWIGSRNHPPRMLTEAVVSRFVPKINRFKARLGGMQGLSEGQRSQVSQAIANMEIAIETGYAIADHLERDDLDGATTLFHEASLPAFKSSWRDLYTVISDLEREYPRR